MLHGSPLSATAANKFLISAKPHLPHYVPYYVPYYVPRIGADKLAHAVQPQNALWNQNLWLISVPSAVLGSELQLGACFTLETVLECLGYR